MAFEAGTLVVFIKANLEGLRKGFAGARDIVNRLGPDLKRLGIILGTAVVAGLTAVIVRSAQFEKQMSAVGSLLGDMEKKVLPGFSRAVRDLAIKTGQSTASLSQGLFDIVSAGIAVKDSFEVLNAAAKLAVGGFTTTAFATQALITVLQTFKGEIKDAADAADFLFAVQKGGRVTVEEVATSIGRFASVAKTAGISANITGAAFAALTLSGEGAEIAATKLQAIFLSLLKPVPAAIKLAKDLKVEISAQALATKGLIPFLEQFSTVSAENLAILFSERLAFRGISDLMTNLAGVQERLNIVTNRAGLSQAAFDRRSKELALTFQKLIQFGKEFLLVIGEQLAPAVEEMFKFVIANKDAILAFAKDLGAAIRDWGHDLRVVFQFVIDNGRIVTEVFTNILGSLKAIANPINLISPAFKALTGTINTARRAVKVFRDETELPIGTLPELIIRAPRPRGARDARAPEIGAVDVDAGKKQTDELVKGWIDGFKKIQEASEEMAERMQRVFDRMTGALASGIKGAFTAILFEGASFGEAMKIIGMSMLNFFLDMIAEMIARWIMRTIVMKAVEAIMRTSLISSFLAAKVIEIATTKAAAVVQIRAWLAVAQAASMAAYAGIPFVGPVLGATQAAGMEAIFAGFTLKAAALAHGGLVERPTLALIGEAGPEAVIPLDKAKRQGLLGGDEGARKVDLTVNISGNFIEGDQVKFEKMVRRAIIPVLESVGLKTRDLRSFRRT